MTTGLHLSVESDDCVDRNIISAVTIELHHHPHPGLEGALDASRDASQILLSLQQLLVTSLEHWP